MSLFLYAPGFRFVCFGITIPPMRYDFICLDCGCEFIVYDSHAEHGRGNLDMSKLTCARCDSTDIDMTQYFKDVASVLSHLEDQVWSLNARIEELINDEEEGKTILNKKRPSLKVIH